MLNVFRRKFGTDPARFCERFHGSVTGAFETAIKLLKGFGFGCVGRMGLHGVHIHIDRPFRFLGNEELGCARVDPVRCLQVLETGYIYSLGEPERLSGVAIGRDGASAVAYFLKGLGQHYRPFRQLVGLHMHDTMGGRVETGKQRGHRCTRPCGGRMCLFVK